MNIIIRDVFAFYLPLTYSSAESAGAQSVEHARRTSNV
jgi:hypothetical protein